MIPLDSNWFQLSCPSIALQHHSNPRSQKNEQNETKPQNHFTCALAVLSGTGAAFHSEPAWPMNQNHPKSPKIHAGATANLNQHVLNWFNNKKPEMHSSFMFTFFPLIPSFIKYAKGGDTPSPTFIVFFKVKPCQTWIKLDDQMFMHNVCQWGGTPLPPPSLCFLGSNHVKPE